MNRKIIIAAGGTGGHIFPALATAGQLAKDDPTVEIIFMAGKIDTNPYFKGSPFPLKNISCGSISSKNPFTLTKNIFGLTKGVWESRNFLRDVRPDIVIGFGSYHTFPVLLGSKWEGIPFLLHESNSIPGKVNRLLSKYAATTCVQFPITTRWLKGKTVVAEMPLREGFTKGTLTRQQAHDYYNLDANKKTLLVFGGSQGAQGINRLMMNCHHDFQVLHLSGSVESADSLRNFYQQNGIKACVKPFEEKMHYAWQAADLVLCRSGAGTIAEQMAFEVPAIFVPYPHAADDHQRINAEFVVNEVKGALVFREKELTSSQLSDCLQKIALDEMKEAINHYKKSQDQRNNFCSIIQQILKGS